MPTAEALILEVAQRDLEEGLEHAREIIRARFSRSIFEKPLEGTIFTALRTLRLETRLREDVTLLCALARRVNAGEDPETLATDNLERALRMRELSLVARTKDAEFAEMLSHARAFFAARLPDLARMVAIDDARDYPELVRRAFPDRKDAEAIVHANTAHITWVVAHLNAHPHLLRLPQAWVPKVAAIAAEIVEWQTARVLTSLDQIYSV